jgi:transcriptional regulator with XRE-family HTH domain
MKLSKMTIGEYLRTLSIQNHLTQASLAEMLHITDKAVSKWERDISYPDISLFPRLVDILGVTVSDLLRVCVNESPDSQLTQFFRTSHDIRTPIHIILGCTDLIKGAVDDPDRINRYLDAIRTSGQYLLEKCEEIHKATQGGAPGESLKSEDLDAYFHRHTVKPESRQFDFSGKRILVTDGPQGIVAQYLFHYGVEMDGDLGMVFRRIRRGLSAGEIPLPDQNVDMTGILGEENRFLRCGETAAHHEYLLAGEEFTVAGGAVSNATAPEIFLTPESHHPGMGTGSQQHTEGLQIPLRGFYGLYISGKFQTFHLSQLELRAENLGLPAHGLGQLLTGGAEYAGIVHHLMGDGDLTAELFLLQHQRAVFGSGKIQCGSQSRRTAADDDYVIEIVHRYLLSGSIDNGQLTISVSALPT